MLQEWFGYCLTPDTRQQKMLMIVGPRRSGKGTIGHVLNQVVGQSNTVWPTTERLGGEFGLQSLIGKTLAIVPDARFSGDKVGVVIERLLSVSGEDRVDINRKFLTGLELRLSTRFMLLSNEIPRLPDSSTALAGRFIILRMNKSFFGHEDTGLLDSLMQELPGILKWAVQGWTRLHERGRFVQPASTVDAAQDMLDLSSPVSAFVRDCCEVRQEYTEIIDVLYRAWRSWCEAEGRGHPTTKAIFLRDLHSAVPGLLVVRNGEQRLYRGLKLVNTTEPPSWT
jgi:putative DNA primase/helicase